MMTEEKMKIKRKESNEIRREKSIIKKELQEKGVTLVALVVTIVVLLILAGISIAMLSGENGLIKQAQNASDEYKIAQIQEQLELAKQAELAKGKGYINVDDYFDRIENEGIINDKETDVVDNGDGTYEITTDKGYIFEITLIPNAENPEDMEIEYVGDGEITGPRIREIEVVEKTETSIKVEVVTRNAEGGNYTYSYKKSTDSNYTQAQTTTDNIYTFSGLEENTEYNIKVKVETSEGSVEKEIKVKTASTEPPEEEIPEGTITFGTATWSEGQASIKISTTSGYEIEYQLNGTAEGRWTNLPSNGIISNLTHNTTVNARLVNGSKRGEIQSTTILDETKPTVTVTQQGSATTNSIAVSVQATDNESGMNTNQTYTYFIKKTSEGSYTQKASNQTNSYTFTELEQETSYDIKVEVQGDNAGNKGEGTLENITTGKITGGEEQGAITFGNPTWSGGQASITISTNTSYKIEYQLNGTTGTWTEIANNGTIQNIPNNTTIYARLTDGNNHGDYTSTTIKDTVNPTVTIESLTAEETTIQITAKGTDNESGINEYIYSIKESTQEDSSYQEKTRNETGTATIEGMEAGKTYTVKVEITDKANNTGSATKEIEIKKPAISSDEISNNPEKYFGGIVSNYECENSAGVNAWQILYADENNIYLITNDYIAYEYLPEGRNGGRLTRGNTDYKVSPMNVLDDYIGSANITDEKIKALNNDYLNVKGYISRNDNMRAVAYMLDTKAWSIFKGEQAEYAIGGPTIELLFKSYNKKYNENYVANAVSELGYRIKHGGESWAGSTSRYIFNRQDNLYVINSEEKAGAMLVASPSEINSVDIMRIFSDGYWGTFNTPMGSEYRDAYPGVRPVVCLKSGIELEEQEDGTYHIIETVRSGKITFGELTWEGENASVTVSTNTTFQIEYQIKKVDEESWTNIENNGKITNLKIGDTVYARLTDGTNHGEYASLTIKKEIAGVSYDIDTDIEIGGYPVTIPAGATISKIPGEYESVEDGVVIYITNGEEITDWNADTNSNRILDVQEKYDQFVWIPVDKESVIIEEGKEITGSTNSEKFTSLKNYVSTNNKYPMAVKKEDGTYSGILYNFTGTKTIKITPINYMSKSTYREPAVLNNDYKEDENENGITQENLQKEFKNMIERIKEKGGFWVGRYETSNLESEDFMTNAINVIKNSESGLGGSTRKWWYTAYEAQKEYKNKELVNSEMTSSMIWGSQWDQIMIWMKDVKNTTYTDEGEYYITNALGLGNYEVIDDDMYQIPTGRNEDYKVKNVYDLAGNYNEFTLEVGSNYRIRRGGTSSDDGRIGASYRYNEIPDGVQNLNASRMTIN